MMPKPSKIKHRSGAPKSYLRRLPDAIKAVMKLPAGRLVGQEWISEHLAVSKATGLRILRATGAELYGNTLLVENERLYLYFEKLRQDPDAQPELRRQSRTAATLAEMARYMSHRQTIVEADPRQLTGMLFKTLSKTKGVSLTVSRLVIDFQGFEDFLAKFGVVVYALQNSLDEIRELLDAPRRDT